MLESLVGKRYKTLEELKNDIEKLTGITGKVVKTIMESQSDRPAGTDFMIDLEFRKTLFPFEVSEIYTIFYLKDNAGNYYITEV